MDEKTRKYHEERIEMVREWLEENVQVFLEPESVTLSDFTVNWDEFSGDFCVSFDSIELPDRLSFGLEASGKTKFYLPMFTSPLGVPASYAAIKITDKTDRAILKGLRETFPRLKGAGIDRKTGKETFYSTPPIDRIEKEVLEQAKKKVTSQYIKSVQLINV